VLSSWELGSVVLKLHGVLDNFCRLPVLLIEQTPRSMYSILRRVSSPLCSVLKSIEHRSTEPLLNRAWGSDQSKISSCYILIKNLPTDSVYTQRSNLETTETNQVKMGSTQTTFPVWISDSLWPLSRFSSIWCLELTGCIVVRSCCRNSSKGPNLALGDLKMKRTQLGIIERTKRRNQSVGVHCHMSF